MSRRILCRDAQDLLCYGVFLDFVGTAFDGVRLGAEIGLAPKPGPGFLAAIAAVAIAAVGAIARYQRMWPLDVQGKLRQFLRKPAPDQFLGRRNRVEIGGALELPYLPIGEVFEGLD